MKKLVNGIEVDMTPEEIAAREAEEAAWAERQAEPPESVTRRQFFLQLEIAGLTEQVEAWVEQQSALVRIAFRESGTFRRDDPGMQAGFAALGVTDEQVADFFAAAAEL